MATVVLVDVRAWRVDSELAWLTALWFTLAALGLVLLPRVLTPRSACVLRWGLVGYASLQIPFIIWQQAQGLPVTGLTPGPGSRYLGALVAVAIPLAPWPFWLAFAGSLFATQSYLAVLAAVVGCLIGTKVLRDRKQIVSQQATTRFLAVALVGTALLVGLSFIRPGPMWQTRVATWNLAWPDFVAHPLIGMGPGGWGTTIPMRQGFSEGVERWPQAHSELVQWVYEEGLLGLGLLGGWLSASARTLWASEVRGGLVALGILALGFHVFHYTAITPWFVLVVGLGLRKET